MKPVSAPTRTSLGRTPDRDWRERSGRLFTEFEPQAKAMVRRAFRGAFSPDELDDIYAGAWVGTLRALADRQAKLADDEIRSYVLTAVANQAGKEIRRRKRKPTAPLELVGAVADDRGSPEELASSAEQSRVTRDLLASLPPRRRAVMLLRYGWGLEPSQVCGLIKGLSARAYRKEITRGVDELTERMRAVERGSWCADREPVLKSFAAGLADAEQQRQARAHLAHCRQCSEFVGRLTGHLHDLGGAVAAVGAIDAHRRPRRPRRPDRRSRRPRRRPRRPRRIHGRRPEHAAQLAAAGGARGAGAAGAGVLAKLAGLGTAGKIVLACAGGGVAATACVAAGVAPFGIGGARTTIAPGRRASDRATAPAPDPKPHAGGRRRDAAVPGRPRVGAAATAARRRDPSDAATVADRARARGAGSRSRRRSSPRSPPPRRRPSRSSASRRRRSPRRARQSAPVGRAATAGTVEPLERPAGVRPVSAGARSLLAVLVALPRLVARAVHRRAPPAASTTSSSATRGTSRPTRSRRRAVIRATSGQPAAPAPSRTATSASTTSARPGTRLQAVHVHGPARRPTSRPSASTTTSAATATTRPRSSPTRASSSSPPAATARPAGPTAASTSTTPNSSSASPAPTPAAAPRASTPTPTSATSSSPSPTTSTRPSPPSAAT